MSSGVKKTNAMRMLDSAKIPYEVRTYEFEETDLAGVHAADAVGMPYETVFKTLVARGDKTGVLHPRSGGIRPQKSCQSQQK